MSQPTTTGTATSRVGNIRQAKRRAAKARLAINGPTGSGKTWTALCTAEIICPGGRFVVIDTEHSDADQMASELYADRFDFDIIPWEAPYDPRDLSLTIREAASLYDVLIVDSGSHFWRKRGGTLDIAGGKFGGWATARPAQEDLVDAILNAACHIIFCTRAKTEYLVDETPAGKQRVEKVGMAGIQDDDLEYEFQVAVMMDLDHNIEIAKTRAVPLAGKKYAPNEQGSFARTYAQWLAQGVNLAPQGDVDAIREAIAQAPADEAARIRGEFKRTFGLPAHLEAERTGEAWAWLAGQMGVDPHPMTVREEGDQHCAICAAPYRAGWHGRNEPIVVDPDVAAVERTPAPPEDTDAAPSEPQEPAEDPDAPTEPEAPQDPPGAAEGPQEGEEPPWPPIERVATMSGRELAPLLDRLGLKKAGTVAELRARVEAALEPLLEAEAELAALDCQDPPTEEAPESAPVAAEG